MKKKLLLSLSLLFVLAVFCVPGMEARAATYVDDLPEGSSGTLKSGQIMTNNYGELRNYGLVHDNYGRMDNFGTTLHNHEDGEVYVYSGSVLENEGYLIYPVFFNDGPYSVDVENNPFVFHEETRWTRLDLDYKFILTPDAGYSIVGFKDLPDYVETSESNGTWTLRLPADRPQGRIGIAPDMIARTMGDNPGSAEATLQISRHMQKNQGILNNYGTLDLNQGTVVNYQGALVKTNEGDVYNMGGRVENNSGTVYSPFSVHTGYGSAGIRYGSGFQNWRGNCWLAQGQAATVEIYPPIGYSVYGFDLPDYMTLAEGNGVRTLQIAAEHPAKAEEINLLVAPTASVPDNPQGSNAALASGQSIYANRGTLENHGVLAVNYGVVVNRGGTVLMNFGTVYNESGAVTGCFGAFGSIYDPVNFPAIDGYTVTFEEGSFTEYGNQIWMLRGAAGMIYIKDGPDPLPINRNNLPEWLTVEETDEGCCITVSPSRSTETDAIELDFAPLSNIVEDNQKGRSARLREGQRMKNNYGDLDIDRDAVLDYNEGKVSIQYGWVSDNGFKGIIKINEPTGTVKINGCVVHNNHGTVIQNGRNLLTNKETGTVITNNDTIMTNQGTVTVNNELVDENQEGGTIVTNNGRINKPNAGTVGTNNAPIGTNGKTGVIQDNRSSIASNAGTVTYNAGTISANSGAVTFNTGTVSVNTGTVDNYGGTVISNSGTVREFFPVTVGFPCKDAVYGGAFTEYDGLHWLYGNGTGTITITIMPYECFDAISTDLPGTDVTALRNDDGSWTVTITNISTSLVLREKYWGLITATAENGTLTADKLSAPAGETVTLTAAPDSDEAHLASLKVMCGDELVETTKAGENTYTFLMPDGDVTAHAVFARSCLVSFVDWNGDVLQWSEMESGQTPAYTGETPARDPDERCVYTFVGWEPEITPVPYDRDRVTYQAVYTEETRGYSVFFLNEDSTILQYSDCAYGDTPVYTGETPVKAANGKQTYIFQRWEPQIAAVREAAVYRPVFDAVTLLEPGQNTVSVEKATVLDCVYMPESSGYYRFIVAAGEGDVQLTVFDGDEIISGGSRWNGGSIECAANMEAGKSYAIKALCFDRDMDLAIDVSPTEMYTVHVINDSPYGYLVIEGGDTHYVGQYVQPDAIVYDEYLDEYDFVDFIVTDENGNPVDNENGLWMPAFDVWVRPVFAPMHRITIELDEEHVSLDWLTTERRSWDLNNAWALVGEYVEMVLRCWEDEYEIAYVTVTAEDGTPIDCLPFVDEENGGVPKYWFVMPDQAVTVRIALSEDVPAFGPADFVLPDSLAAIEAGAFAGDALIAVVDAHSCAAIGAGAFSGCAGLTQILLPKDCTIAGSAFTDCDTVLVYAPSGGRTQTTCDRIPNCAFVDYTLS